MKPLKENDLKVTKDVLLHQIFKEISDENKDINNDPYLDEIIPIPKRKLFKIREIKKKWQWFFVVMFMISSIYMLFNTDTKSIQNEEQIGNTDIYTISKSDQIEKPKTKNDSFGILKEEDKDQNIVKKINPIKITEKTGMKEKESQAQAAVILKEPQTAREKAKQTLFSQMQN